MPVHTKREVETSGRVVCVTGYLTRRGGLDWEDESGKTLSGALVILPTRRWCPACVGGGDRTGERG